MREPRLKPIHALLVIVIGIAMLLMWGVKGTVDAHKAGTISQTQAGITADTVRSIRQIRISLVDAETAQRGFVITEDKDYLAAYHESVERYRTAILTLNERAGHQKTREQIRILFNVKKLAEEKIAEMNQTIAYVNEGQRSRANNLIRSGDGKRLMSEILEDLNALYNLERASLDQAFEAAISIQKITFRRFIAMGIGVIILLMSIIYLFRRLAAMDQTLDLLKEVDAERERSDLLSKELSHRVKNLFAVISSIVRLTGRNETDTGIAVTKITERIQALSKAHSLTVSQDRQDDTDLKSLVTAILAPYETSTRVFSIKGPHLSLTQKTLTPLGLLLHELATNAIKYGAWSTDIGGRIDISWTITPTNEQDDISNVVLFWNESSDAALQKADFKETGFGFKMMSMSMRQLDGEVSRDWDAGLKMTARFKVERTPLD